MSDRPARSEGARPGLVLLHGIARTSASMRPLEQAARRAGFETLNLDYPSRRLSLEDLTEAIHPEIASFAAGLAGPIGFLTHSMGGLLVRLYIARHRPERLGRVVMLAPPNQGSEIADLLAGSRPYRAYFGPAGRQLVTAGGQSPVASLAPVDYELGIIAGDRSLDPVSWMLIPGANDGKVAVERTRLDGATGHIIIHTTHPTMLFNREVIAEAIAFLLDGCFSRAALKKRAACRR